MIITSILLLVTIIIRLRISIARLINIIMFASTTITNNTNTIQITITNRVANNTVTTVATIVNIIILIFLTLLRLLAFGTLTFSSAFTLSIIWRSKAIGGASIALKSVVASFEAVGALMFQRGVVWACVRDVFDMMLA